MVTIVPLTDRQAEWEKAYKKLFQVKCLTCGEEFRTENPKREFCSNLCYRRHGKGGKALK